MDYQSYNRRNNQSSSNSNYKNQQQLTPKSTAEIGEDAVKTVFHIIVSEIEKKCDLVIRTTVKEYKASSLEEDLRKNQCSSSNSNLNSSNHNSPSFDNFSIEQQISQNQTILGLPADYLIIYSNPVKCLEALQQRTPAMEQSLLTLNSLAEFCLPSLVSALFSWLAEQLDDKNDMRLGIDPGDAHSYATQYSNDRQLSGGFRLTTSKRTGAVLDPANQGKQNPAITQNTQVIRRSQCLNYYFGLILSEILPRLKQNPLENDLLVKLITHCFKFFDDPQVTTGDLLVQEASRLPNTQPRDTRFGRIKPNVLTNAITEKYSECLGMIAQRHFKEVKSSYKHQFSKFEMLDPQILIKRETSGNTMKMVRYIKGMKHFKIPCSNKEMMEVCLDFVHTQLGKKFIETKNRDIRQEYASTLVSILIPLSTEVRMVETNIPKLRELVEALYHHSHTLVRKNHMSFISYRLVTALLCLAKHELFAERWTSFLEACLKQIGNAKSDPKLTRVLLDCIQRLVYVYTIRLHGIVVDDIPTRQRRIGQIFKVLFPSRNGVPVPKDAPVAGFVRLLYYISKHNINIAMSQILELLGHVKNKSVSKSLNITIYPERMNIGLRAYLYISDCLRQKHEMPKLPSLYDQSNTIKAKINGNMTSSTHLTTAMSEEEAKEFKLDSYYNSVKQVFQKIMRSLESTVGRSYLRIAPNTQLSMKPHEIKSILDENPKRHKYHSEVVLYKTCIGALPIITPLSNNNLADQSLAGIFNFGNRGICEVLCRALAHADDGVRDTAKESLWQFVKERKDIREQAVVTLCNFLIDRCDDNSAVFIIQDGVAHLALLFKTWLEASQNDSKLGSEDDVSFLPKLNDAQPNPNFHGPMSSCTLAIKRCQAFVLAILPSWVNFIKPHNLDPANSKESDSVKASQEFIWNLIRILEYIEQLKDNLKLDKEGDGGEPSILKLINKWIKVSVSTGEISRCIGIEQANQFRQLDVNTLQDFFNRQFLELTTKENTIQLGNDKDLKEKNYFELLSIYDKTIRVLASIFAGSKVQSQTSESTFGTPSDGGGGGTGTVKAEKTVIDLQKNCGVTMIFTWRDLYRRIITLNNCVKILTGNNSGGENTITKSFRTFYQTNPASQYDHNIDKTITIFGNCHKLYCSVARKSFEDRNLASDANSSSISWLEPMTHHDHTISSRIKALVEVIKNCSLTPVNQPAMKQEEYDRKLNNLRESAVYSLGLLNSECITELAQNLLSDSLIQDAMHRKIGKRDKNKKPDVNRIWLLKVLQGLAVKGVLPYLDQTVRPEAEDRTKLWDAIKNLIMNCLVMVEPLEPFHVVLNNSTVNPPSFPPSFDPHLHVLRHELAQFFITIVQYSPNLELQTDLVTKIHDVYARQALDNFKRSSNKYQTFNNTHFSDYQDALPDVDLSKRFEVEVVLCALVAKRQSGHAKNNINPFMATHKWLAQYLEIIQQSSDKNMDKSSFQEKQLRSLAMNYFPRIVSQYAWCQRQEVVNWILSECYCSNHNRASIGLACLKKIVRNYIEKEKTNEEKTLFNNHSTFNQIQVFAVCFYWLKKTDMGDRYQAMSLLQLVVSHYEEALKQESVNLRHNSTIELLHQLSLPHFFKTFANNFPELSYAIIGEFLGHRVLTEGVSMINILEIVQYFLKHIELAKLINYNNVDKDSDANRDSYARDSNKDSDFQFPTKLVVKNWSRSETLFILNDLMFISAKSFDHEKCKTAIESCWSSLVTNKEFPNNCGVILDFLTTIMKTRHLPSVTECACQQVASILYSCNPVSCLNWLYNLVNYREAFPGSLKNGIKQPMQPNFNGGQMDKDNNNIDCMPLDNTAQLSYDVLSNGKKTAENSANVSMVHSPSESNGNLLQSGMPNSSSSSNFNSNNFRQPRPASMHGNGVMLSAQSVEDVSKNMENLGVSRLNTAANTYTLPTELKQASTLTVLQGNKSHTPNTFGNGNFEPSRENNKYSYIQSLLLNIRANVPAHNYNIGFSSNMGSTSNVNSASTNSVSAANLQPDDTNSENYASSTSILQHSSNPPNIPVQIPSNSELDIPRQVLPFFNNYLPKFIEQIESNVSGDVLSCLFAPVFLLSAQKPTNQTETQNEENSKNLWKKLISNLLVNALLGLDTSTLQSKSKININNRPSSSSNPHHQNHQKPYSSDHHIRRYCCFTLSALLLHCSNPKTLNRESNKKLKKFDLPNLAEDDNTSPMIDSFFAIPEFASFTVYAQLFEKNSLMKCLRSRFMTNPLANKECEDNCGIDLLHLSDMSPFWNWLNHTKTSKLGSPNNENNSFHKNANFNRSYRNQKKSFDPNTLSLIQSLVTAGSESFSSQLWCQIPWQVSEEFKKEKMRFSTKSSTQLNKLSKALIKEMMFYHSELERDISKVVFGIIDHYFGKTSNSDDGQSQTEIPKSSSSVKNQGNTENQAKSQQKHPTDQQMFKLTRCLQIYQSLTPGNSSSCTKDLTKLFTKLEATASSSQEKEMAFVVEILNTIDRLLVHIHHTEFSGQNGVSSSTSFQNFNPNFRSTIGHKTTQPSSTYVSSSVPTSMSAQSLVTLKLDSNPNQYRQQNVKKSGLPKHRHKRNSSQDFKHLNLKNSSQQINTVVSQNSTLNPASLAPSASSGRGTILNGQFRSEIDLSHSTSYDQNLSFSTPRQNNRTPEPGVIPLSNSRPSSLKHNGRLDIYAKFVYIFAALAESDFEHEYLYALRLLRKSFKMISLKEEVNRKVLDKIYNQSVINQAQSQASSAQSSPTKQPTSPDPSERSTYGDSKVNQYSNQINGIATHLYKGLTNQNLAIREETYDLMVDLLPYFHHSFINAGQFQEKHYFTLEYDAESNFGSTCGSNQGSTRSLNIDTDSNFGNSTGVDNLAKYNSLTSFILMSFSVLPSLICEFGEIKKSSSVIARADVVKETALQYCRNRTLRKQQHSNFDTLAHNMGTYTRNHLDGYGCVKQKEKWITKIVQLLHKIFPQALSHVFRLLVSFFENLNSSNNKQDIFDNKNTKIGDKYLSEKHIDESSNQVLQINAVLEIIGHLVEHAKETFDDCTNSEAMQNFAQNLHCLIQPVTKLNTKTEYASNCRKLLHKIAQKCSSMDKVKYNHHQMPNFMGATHSNLPGLTLKFDPFEMKPIGMKHIQKVLDVPDTAGNPFGPARTDSCRQSTRRQREQTGMRRANWNKPSKTTINHTRKQIQIVRKKLFPTEPWYPDVVQDVGAVVSRRDSIISGNSSIKDSDEESSKEVTVCSKQAVKEILKSKL